MPSLDAAKRAHYGNKYKKLRALTFNVISNVDKYLEHFFFTAERLAEAKRLDNESPNVPHLSESRVLAWIVSLREIMWNSAAVSPYDSDSYLLMYSGALEGTAIAAILLHQNYNVCKTCFDLLF